MSNQRESVSDLLVPVTSHDHVRGFLEAAVVLVEYADFECPFCTRAEPVVLDLLQRFGADLCLVFRYNPRRFDHAHARLAAQAAEAAGAQGKFWPMHDILLARQSALEANDLVRYARELGLDIQRFAMELAARTWAKRVREMELGGVKSHVISTPTFFINGHRYRGKPDLEEMDGAIRAALEHAQERRCAG